MKNNPTVQREDENRGVKRKILILILILLLILLFSAITAATGGFHAFARALGLNAGGYTDNIGSTNSTGTKLGEPSGNGRRSRANRVNCPVVDSTITR